MLDLFASLKIDFLNLWVAALARKLGISPKDMAELLLEEPKNKEYLDKLMSTIRQTSDTPA